MNIIDFLFVFKWWAVFFMLGTIFLPLAFKLFSSFLDKGYIFSKVLGISILSYLIFVVGIAHVLPFTRILSVAILIVLAVFFWIKISFKKKILSVGTRKDVLQFLRKNYKVIVFEEALFFLGLLFWSFIRAHNPDIHDLEKYMDFGFINSILRSDYFPPKDMWFTPLPINYYYFGHLVTAVLTKLSGIPSNISFNLMIASIFAFTLSCSFSIGINLSARFLQGKSKQLKGVSSIKAVTAGLLTSFIVTLGGNLQSIYSLFKPYNVDHPVPFWQLQFSPESFPNSYWYPNATRFIFHTIHEFPIYSFVVADLHGHVLSIPLILTIIAFLMNCFFVGRLSLPRAIFLAFFLSLSYMTNAWDGIIYIGLTTFLVFYLISKDQTKKWYKSILKTGLKTTGMMVFIGVFLMLFSLPFNHSFIPFASQIGMVCPPKFLIDVGQVGPFIFEDNACQKSPIWQILILFGFFFFWILSFLIYLYRTRKFYREDALVSILIIFSGFLIVAPEIFYLKDIYTGHFRANTMFKLFYQAFIILGISSGYIITRVFSDTGSLGKNIFGRVLFTFASATIFSLISIYTYFSITSGYNLKTYKGLDGTIYLQEKYPKDYKAILWINKNIKGQPIILEAQGDSYTDYARVSANTGLPTVLGWTVHEWLWRGSYDIPSPRISDVTSLYETGDIEVTRRLIEKYKIKYVFVGNLERKKYLELNEGKFQELGQTVYFDGTTRIYEIPNSF